MPSRAQVLGSQATVRAHVERARTMGVLSYFEASARRHSLPLDVLIGLASHESNMGAALDASGKGDGGNAWGLMQIDQRYHRPFTSTHSPFDHQAVIEYGAALLADYRRQLAGNLAHAIAAYNAGVGGVRAALAAGRPADAPTTPYKAYGVGFSEIVLHRAALARPLLAVAVATATSGLVVALLAAGAYYLWKK